MLAQRADLSLACTCKMQETLQILHMLYIAGQTPITEATLFGCLRLRDIESSASGAEFRKTLEHASSPQMHRGTSQYLLRRRTRCIRRLLHDWCSSTGNFVPRARSTSSFRSPPRTEPSAPRSSSCVTGSMLNRDSERHVHTVHSLLHLHLLAMQNSAQHESVYTVCAVTCTAMSPLPPLSRGCIGPQLV